MQGQVEIRYDPYKPNVSIMLNGQQVPEFSRLVRYNDEDIWDWADEILGTVHDELRDNFVVHFTGTPEDAEIMRLECGTCESCSALQVYEFLIPSPLQERMKSLNQYIRKTGVSSFTHTGYEVVFAVSGDMKKYTQDLLELDVHNRFTDVHTAVIDRVEDYSPGENRCLIVLTSSAEQAESKIPGSKNGLPVFVIEVGSGDGQVRTVKKGMWVLACRPDGIFDAVFHCLLQGPLRIAFRRCMQSLLQKHTDVELAKIGAVDPVLLVQVADRIEAGTSASIGVSADPPVAVLPELEFAVLNQKVAYCNGLTVYGKEAGTTEFGACLKGSRTPFFRQMITVYTRNRIKSLVLSEDSMLLGIGDTLCLSADYSPQDADNVQDICWSSSNRQVAGVDKRGRVTAVGRGECRIICTAENVSAQCVVRVKPHLESITLNEETAEDGSLYIQPMDEITPELVTCPGDCMDDTLTMTSSDSDIVNVVGDRLVGKKEGTAVITVTNENRRVRFEFPVTVTRKKMKKKDQQGKGFFARLFG